MGRRVGEFINPETGEKDWLDVSTVKNIRLLPEKAVCFNDYCDFVIEYKLDNIDMLKVVTLTAEAEIGKKKYKSEPQYIDELEFAHYLAEVVYDDRTIDNEEFMLDLKERAKNDLQYKLLRDNYIIGNFELDGAGFVYSGDKKVMTIEKMAIRVEDVDTINVELIDCVGPIDLGNVIDPKIVFYSSDLEIKIDNFQIKSSTHSRLKKYTVHPKLIFVSETDEHVYFDVIQPGDNQDEYIDELIANRQAMLDDLSKRENLLDERFADIL